MSDGDVKQGRDYHRIGLWGILLLAAALRLAWLGSVPNGFHIDELAIGYDAFSLMKTGRDMFGEFLPMFARSFGDYDEALYRYLAIPSIAVFGLNEFAVRLPAALAGIATVWVLYLMARIWFGPRVALAAALLLAISPWHVLHSRWAVRAVLLPLFFCLGLYFFGRRSEHSRFLIFGAMAFAASLHTYNSARVFVPLFVFGLFLIHWRDLLASRRAFYISALIFLGVMAGLMVFWISPEGLTRAKGTLQWRPGAIVGSYISYFNPLFLFWRGDPSIRHSLPQMGMLHFFECVTVVLGIWSMRSQNRQTRRIAWLWLLLYPIPAALTGSAHAIRTLIGAPLFALLSGCGLVWLADRFSKIEWRGWLYGAGIALFAASLAFFCKFYFYDYARYQVMPWLYGMREAIAVAEKSPHRVVVVSYAYYPAIFYLFYGAYPPGEYQKLSLDARLHFCEYAYGPLGRYYFGRVGNMTLSGSGILVVAMAEEIAELSQHYTWRDIHRVMSPRGKIAVWLVEITGVKHTE